MATIANYTPDAIEWWHLGVNGFIKPGDVKEFDDARANHILNAYGRRGLVQMQFGDDPEVKKKASMSAWTSFWEEQITGHNRINEDRRENKKLGPLHPSKELEEKAKVLGVELLKPWRVEKKDNEEINKLKEENQGLKETIGKLSAQMEKLMDIVTAPPGNRPTAISSDAEKALAEKVAENRRKYKSLRVNTMTAWLKNNWDDIKDMPEENRFEITTQYQDLYQTPFPAEKPE